MKSQVSAPMAIIIIVVAIGAILAGGWYLVQRQSNGPGAALKVEPNVPEWAKGREGPPEPGVLGGKGKGRQ